MATHALEQSSARWPAVALVAPARRIRDTPLVIAGTIAIVAVGGLVGVELPSWLAIAIALLAVATSGGSVLSWLLKTTHGRTLLRVQLPEPTDPSRSVVEHANTSVLAMLAAIGAAGHLGLFLLFGSTSFQRWLLLAGTLYVGCWLCRWLLPTAGTLNPETGQLTVTSWPDTEIGRSWHGALETTRELACDDIDSLRRLPIGDTTIVWLRTAKWPPVIAALPSSVGDRLTVDCC